MVNFCAWIVVLGILFPSISLIRHVNVQIHDCSQKGLNTLVAPQPHNVLLFGATTVGIS